MMSAAHLSAFPRYTALPPLQPQQQQQQRQPLGFSVNHTSARPPVGGSVRSDPASHTTTTTTTVVADYRSPVKALMASSTAAAAASSPPVSGQYSTSGVGLWHQHQLPTLPNSPRAACHTAAALEPIRPQSRLHIAREPLAHQSSPFIPPAVMLPVLPPTLRNTLPAKASHSCTTTTRTTFLPRHTSDSQKACAAPQDHHFPMCAYCCKLLRHKFLKTYHGELLCFDHRDESSKTFCQECGRVIPKSATPTAPAAAAHGPAGSNVLALGQASAWLQCDSCKLSAVVSEPNGMGLLQQVWSTMIDTYGMPYFPITWPLLLLSWKELQNEARRIGHVQDYIGAAGLTRRTTNAQGAPRVEWIAVLRGLSYDYMGMLLAHELTHAFLYSNGYEVEKMGVVMEEGLCELVSYLWMSSPSQAQKINYRFWCWQMRIGSDRIYHRGYTLARAAYDYFCDRVGKARALPALFQYVRQTNAFPEVPGAATAACALSRHQSATSGANSMDPATAVLPSLER